MKSDIKKLLNLQNKVPAWKRLIAFLIDLTIVNLIVLQPLESLTKKFLPSTQNFISLYSSIASSNVAALSIIAFLTGILTFLYWVILDYKIQQTPGGIVFHLKTKSLLNKNLKFSQSLIRNITKISLPLLVIDSIFILTAPNGQRLFEKLSNTITAE
jgi:uncharacterized RDD family membrane protein YckC